MFYNVNGDIETESLFFSMLQLGYELLSNKDDRWVDSSYFVLFEVSNELPNPNYECFDSYRANLIGITKR